ncbi:hypothetical protein [Undibacterium sp.]|jgi:hypothetical protein|uniref:hypothetical protein n=1 Tax=Undibacterium sp. TaxID=1914977 RepID=UPI002BB6B741|nr:hypothetical protein [Undibacterium sp.]HTD02334.1 hypothetical protein [Undibacterium sp.]
MKKILLAAALVAASGSIFAADVGVSINFAQPGMYGRVDIGSVPGPQVVYTRPTVIYAPPVGVVREPLYLYVPPGHQKNWSKHCASYNACGQPVYFVQESWYRDVYVPRYREHDHGRDRRDDDRRGHDDRDDHGDHDRGHGRGNDERRGRGHGDD